MVLQEEITVSLILRESNRGLKKLSKEQTLVFHLFYDRNIEWIMGRVKLACIPMHMFLANNQFHKTVVNIPDHRVIHRDLGKCRQTDPP